MGLLSKNIAIFLLLTAIVGCEHPKITKEAPDINHISANQKFTINLNEDHRDGSNWQLLPDYDSSVIQRLNDVWHGNEKGIYFNLKAGLTGSTTLHFVKRKYTDTLDTKQFIIQITK